MQVGRPRSLRRAVLVGVIGLACSMPGLALAQCAMCGTVGQGSEDPLVKGMFASILFMVAMPFALAGTVGGWFYYTLRRGALERDDAAASVPVELETGPATAEPDIRGERQ